MKKTPTLLVRDPEDRKHVLPEVAPGCEWVLAGEGVATRKYDGTCVLIRRDGMNVQAFTRREVKPGKPTPAGFFVIEKDETTGKTVGWEPYVQSGYASQVREALHPGLVPGTYELLGPKVQGNPEGYEFHTLVRHADAERVDTSAMPSHPTGVIEFVKALCERTGWEGVVWHHPDGRMAKLKGRDCP